VLPELNFRHIRHTKRRKEVYRTFRNVSGVHPTFLPRAIVSVNGRALILLSAYHDPRKMLRDISHPLDFQHRAAIVDRRRLSILVSISLLESCQQSAKTRRVKSVLDAAGFK
jgi:hypothetical protein